MAELVDVLDLGSSEHRSWGFESPLSHFLASRRPNKSHPLKLDIPARQPYRSLVPTTPRSAQIDVETTPYYHCIARCVRRAFLCGADPYTGSDFDHRKPWFLERLKLACEVFAIDVCAYAVMSNHFHAVLRVDSARASSWSDEAVLRRYAKFFPNAARAVRDVPMRERAERIAELRSRLSSISWFMRVLCEHIARRANAEDEVTGRFWEGRFKCQALLDEGALYTCMSYVDLNPVRAGIATRLDECEFTSIEQRLREAGAREPVARGVKRKTSTVNEGLGVPLAPLRGEARPDGGRRRVLDFRFDDYIELLEWTGRAQRSKPGGRLRGEAPAALAVIGADVSAWLSTMRGRALLDASSLGSDAMMAREAERRGCKWLRGKRLAAHLFSAIA